MRNQNMRVFHGVVNYGTQSGFLAKEMRKNGIEACSVTAYDRFDRITDVRLKHSGANILQKICNYTWNKFYLFRCFFSYNIFHFYASKTLTKSQWDLPLYRLFGKKVVFEYLGIDVQKYKYSVENFEFTNIVHLINENKAEEHDRTIEEKLERHSKYADLQLVCAPCYSPFVPGATVLPLGIDLNEYTYTPMRVPGDNIKIMHAPTHRGNKGTKFILEAVDQLSKEGIPVEMMLIENVSHSRLKELYVECDIFVDQILFWYGTAAIEAMALGRPVVCSHFKEFYKYVNYAEKIPMINADPDTIYDKLKYLIENKDYLPGIGKRSREFVEEVHNLEKKTQILIDLYKKL